VLFDIDGTLISRAGPHHKQALIEAIRALTNCVVSLDDIPTHGMLDGDLLRLLLKQSSMGDAAGSAVLPSLMAEAQRYYLQNCPSDLRHRVCPGVVNLLENLTAEGVFCATVSGNLSAIGWKKLELAGLRSYFRAGVFADHGETRAELVATALSAVRQRGEFSPNAAISLIGDHPNDVRAARANSVRAIAVATGLSSLEELRQEQPDLLLENLTSLSIEHFR
jgi:phosphoglycolate phosphatase-like HAD superfamily hydrolase